MNITYYGQSCFTVNINGYKLLFDPFISANPIAQHIDVNSIEADFILISHGHFDHIADAEAIAKRTKAQVICSWEIFEWLGKKGVENIHPMNTGGEWHFEFGLLKCLVANHSSGLPDGAYGGNPMGFAVTAWNETFYYSGDTGLTYDMKMVGEFIKPSVALLPIGGNFTMGYKDAAIAAQWSGVSKVIGLHYDTFPYIVIDKEAAKQHFAENGIELILLEIGSTITI